VPHLTLDDAATLLLQLEPGDLNDLARLREALTTLVFENRVPITAQPHVARAARLLGTLVDRTATDTDATITDVSRAIEAAMQASDAAASAPRVSAPTVSAPAASAPVPAPVAVVATIAAAASADELGPESLPDDTDLDLLGDFLTESTETLQAAEAALLDLEADPANSEAINTVFRAFHTVKGTSAFLGLGRVAAFAHEAESLLSRVRDGEIAYTQACAELSLAASDMLKALLHVVRQAAATGGAMHVPAGYAALFEALATYDPAREPSGAPRAATEAPPAPVASAPVPLEAAAVAPAVPAAPAASSAAPAAAATGSPGARDSGADATIRVRTDRLDRLIDMVGELVIAQSMIAGDPELDARVQHELARKITHAGKIVRELQDLSMSMRMIELRPTFQKLARVVRDTAVKAGKEVAFSISGEDVEIDRQLADLLGDPLVHMVRNAVDHGVERPEERVAAGKARTGSVRLTAYHASGNVVVELVDDGRGLHREKIVAKAIEKGLLESDKGMSDSEVFNLIFAPGFSTAEKVTDISGRGVGMDVVRRNLEAIRGRIDITSTPGAGTTFAIRLPLTLAVTDGMLVRVGQERFVVPTTNIHMSFRPEPSMLSTVVGKGEVVLLRGELMPIVRLHRLFEVPGAVEHPCEGLLMIVGDAERRTALLVDELLGQHQVVAKSLGESLGRVRGLTGGAILGDGRVGLILDVAETVALAQGASERSLAERPAGRVATAA
jgi:two-component system chemotaxis sensor kinase CheA